MKKTLWISDLDGTLLNRNKQITPTTAMLLNDAIAEGIHFSVATARTPATVTTLLERIQMNVPVVVMNGAAIYDLRKGQYIHVTNIPMTHVVKIQEILKAANKNAFIYCIEEDALVAHYDALQLPCEVEFFEERQNNPQKKFVQGDLSESAKVVHIAIIGPHAMIRPIEESLGKIPGLSLIGSTDVYHEDVYYLEVYNEAVSKASAIDRLCELYGYTYRIAFGDNLNDLAMFEHADACYAVENALEVVKNVATEVIASNEADGVAKFIAANRQK